MWFKRRMGVCFHCLSFNLDLFLSTTTNEIKVIQTQFFCVSLKEEKVTVKSWNGLQRTPSVPLTTYTSVLSGFSKWHRVNVRFIFKNVKSLQIFFPTHFWKSVHTQENIWLCYLFCLIHDSSCNHRTGRWLTALTSIFHCKSQYEMSCIKQHFRKKKTCN